MEPNKPVLVGPDCSLQSGPDGRVNRRNSGSQSSGRPINKPIVNDVANCSVGCSRHVICKERNWNILKFVGWNPVNVKRLINTIQCLIRIRQVMLKPARNLDQI